LLVLAAMGGNPFHARAELTVEAVISNAVTGVGPYVQDVTDAIKKFGEGDVVAAKTHLESAKKSTPRLPPVEVMLARLYFDAGQPAGGVGMLELAMRKAPQDPEAAVMLGERAVAEGRVTEAGLLFERVARTVEGLTDNPRRRQDLQARLNGAWATVDEANENWPAAQKKLAELVRLDTRNASAHERLARALFRQGQVEKAPAVAKQYLEKAYEEFKAAASADPKLPPAELNMAAQFNDKAKAELWLNHALTRSGKDLRTQLAAAQYRVTENRLDEAQKHVDEALAIDPTGLDVNFLAGLIARLRADYPAAQKYLSQAHLLAPANAEITNHLALALVELPDESSHNRALQFATMNAQQQPDRVQFVMTLGWINYRLGRKAEAKKALTAAFTAVGAATNGRMNSDMGYYLANVAKDDANRVPYAIQLLKNALNSNEPFAYRKPAQELLARLEKQAGATAPAGQSPPTTPTSTSRSKAGDAATKTGTEKAAGTP
jgi:tetratricopeptide (TPR) repeat protein